MIYLDHNATTPVLDEVIEAMMPFYRDHYGNPSSTHTYGVAARQAMDWARGKVASLIGAAPEEIIFTGSGTESNNIAICGFAQQYDGGHLVTSTIEHSAVARPCDVLEEQGWQITTVGVDDDGRLDLDAFEAALEDATRLVSIMHVNNETGAIQPVSEAAALAREHDAVVHTDAAQSLGKMHVDVDELGVDLLTIAGHKLYGPKGIGALFIREGIELAPVVVGAGHERGLRPGTENVPAIVGLGKACEIAQATLNEEVERQCALRERLWERLSESISGMTRHGNPRTTVCNTLNVSFPNVFGEALLMGCDAVAASTGSACHESEHAPSTVLLQMGCDPEEANGSVRLSVGKATTEDDIDEAASALVSAWKKMQ
ncbi:MAG: cysteine desulfurase family protein [Myxococcota bacterium]